MSQAGESGREVPEDGAGVGVLAGVENVVVLAADERRLEVVAHGLPCYHDSQLAIDVALRSVLNTEGEP